MSDIDDAIDDAIRARSAARNGHRNPQQAADAEQLLEELYDRRRRVEAEQRHGPTDAIVKRARVERELEKLMAE